MPISSFSPPLAAFAACAVISLAHAEDPVALRGVRAMFDPGENILSLECRLEIPEPWNISTGIPSQRDLVVTGVRLADSTLGDLVNREYPPALSKVLFGKQRPVYEGDLVIKDVFRLDKKAAFPVVLVLHYQSCSENICLPPRYQRIMLDQDGDDRLSARF